MKIKTLSKWAIVPALGLALTGCAANPSAGKNTSNSSGTATNYPTKPVTMVVAFNAGGPSDVQARAVQPALEKALGQKLLFMYKTGAGGAVGFQYLAHSKADGYTVGGVNVPHIILQPLAHQGDFQWTDFTFIAQSYDDPAVLAVKKGSKIKTLKDFIAACKANPGKVTVGGVGTMTGHYLDSYLIQDKLGVKFQYVPFSGSAPEDAALLGGHVDVMIGNFSDVERNRDQYTVLAVAAKTRNPIDKTIPTFKEQGYDIEASIQRGFAVPKDTPKPVVTKLRAAFKTALNDPGYKKKMESMGAPIKYLDGPAFKQEIEQIAKSSVAELKKYNAIQSK